MTKKKVLDGRKEAKRAIKVKLDIEHNPKLKAQLDKAMKMVSKFFNFAPRMFQSFLYNFDHYIEWAQETGKGKLPEGFDPSALKDVYEHIPQGSSILSCWGYCQQCCQERAPLHP